MENSSSQNGVSLSVQKKRNAKPQPKRKATIGLFRAMKEDFVSKEVSETTPEDQTKQKQTKKQKCCMNPQFKVYSENINDPFWKEILLEISKGKPPKGFVVRRDRFYYRDTKKNISLFLSPDPMAAQKYIDFMKLHGLIFSEEDINENEKYISTFSSKSKRIVPSSCWEEIKKRKTLCYHLLREYSLEVTKRFNLTPSQKKDFQTMLNYRYTRKDISPDDINMEDGVIISINGLVLDKDKMEFDFVLNSKNKPKPLTKQLLTRESVNELLSKEFPTITKSQWKQRRVVDWGSLLTKYFSGIGDSEGTQPLLSYDTIEV